MYNITLHITKFHVKNEASVPFTILHVDNFLPSIPYTAVLPEDG